MLTNLPIPYDFCVGVLLGAFFVIVQLGRLIVCSSIHDAAPRYLLLLPLVADYLLITIIIIVRTGPAAQPPTCRPAASTPSTLHTLDTGHVKLVSKLQ